MNSNTRQLYAAVMQQQVHSIHQRNIRQLHRLGPAVGSLCCSLAAFSGWLHACGPHATTQLMHATQHSRRHTRQDGHTKQRATAWLWAHQRFVVVDVLALLGHAAQFGLGACNGSEGVKATSLHAHCQHVRHLLWAQGSGGQWWVAGVVVIQGFDKLVHWRMPVAIMLACDMWGWGEGRAMVGVIVLRRVVVGKLQALAGTLVACCWPGTCRRWLSHGQATGVARVNLLLGGSACTSVPKRGHASVQQRVASP